jgi:DNA invertase Pin-like site-specific DNA recombinase
LQLAALKKAGCQTVFKDEGISGATTKRPALLLCLKKLEHGDTLIVWKLDRLGRSLRDLITMLDDLRARGVKFHSLTEAIDTATPTGRAMWQMIGVLAELERSLISERTRAGVKAAQRRGVKFGRKVKLTPAQIDHVRKLIDKGEARQYVQYVADLVPDSSECVYSSWTRGNGCPGSQGNHYGCSVRTAGSVLYRGAGDAASYGAGRSDLPSEWANGYVRRRNVHF